jgi:hypothetical protein
MARYVRIQYTGVGAPRYDNVIPRSGRVWPEVGSVLEVPEDEAAAYLAHPGTFKRLGVEAVDDLVTRDANKPENVDKICALLTLLTKDNLGTVIEAAQGLLAEPEEVKEPAGDTSTPEAAKATQQRIQAVTAAIQAMPKNRDNFDAKDRPILAAVQRQSRDKTVTQREIDAAMATMKRASF